MNLYMAILVATCGQDNVGKITIVPDQSVLIECKAHQVELPDLGDITGVPDDGTAL